MEVTTARQAIGQRCRGLLPFAAYHDVDGGVLSEDLLRRKGRIDTAEDERSRGETPAKRSGGAHRRTVSRHGGVVSQHDAIDGGPG